MFSLGDNEKKHTSPKARAEGRRYDKLKVESYNYLKYSYASECLNCPTNEKKLILSSKEDNGEV